MVHGDNWYAGYQANVRREVLEVLREWGGELVDMTSRIRTLIKDT